MISIVFFLAISCEKDGDTLSNEEDIILSPDTLFSSYVIDSTILVTDTLNSVFSQIKYPDNFVITKEFEYSKLFRNAANSDSNLLIEYVPQYGFLGIDTLLAVCTTTNDTASHITLIDTVKLIVRVVENDFHRKLIGRWILDHYNYGPLNYPTEEGTTFIVEYDNSMRYRQFKNESLVFDLRYEMGGTSTNDKRYFYIDYEDGDYNTSIFMTGSWLRTRTNSGKNWANWMKME